MDNTNANETPLFGKKPKVEEPAAAPVTAAPAAAPAAPTAKKTSVGLIIGAIITAAAFIAASVVLVIVLITRQPNTSSKKSDESSEEKKEEEEKPTPDKDEDEDEDKDDDENEDEDKDDDEDEDEEGEDEDTEDEQPAANGSVSINGKSFKLSTDYVTTVKSMLDTGLSMTYEDSKYKEHELTKSTLDDYLSVDVKYTTEAAIIDANEDELVSIEGVKKEYGKATVKVSDVKLDHLYYSATTPLTLPNGKKVSCYNTTKDQIFDMFGKGEVSSLNIVQYTVGGYRYSFHLDKSGELETVFIYPQAD